MMTANGMLDKNWQVQASRLPGALLSAMASGQDTGALSLSPTHVRDLNEYVAYTRGLPNSPAGIYQWMGGGQANPWTLILSALMSSNPELNGNAMLTFSRQVKQHANGWEVLYGKNLQLTHTLVTVASNINRSGEVILDVCAQTKALGKQREAWDALLGGEALALSVADRQIVSSLPMYVNALKEQLKGYAREVERVRIEATRFRDEARIQVIPAATRKVNEIAKLVKPATQGGIAGILGQILQSRFLELSGKLRKLEQLLRAVVTASSHVHSAWQSLTAYIDASSNQLQLVTSGQQLARFAIYFGRFLGLWKTIEQSAVQMNRTLTRYQP
ncbi:MULTISPECIES: hypothetical protein [Pseudomonas]|uniref:hypothetical protein n=1 Tax=Pseudomonas TaxID=286 RepID=UPI001BCF98D8|nr:MULTISPECIES: hypothetical protein [Pseudomonas]MBS7597500.1 hypothetical protein [Pseudomonas sp. RC2C2]UVL28459.1 hypothetical protein LOY32_20090 [Pseudomonas donghuensis]